MRTIQGIKYLWTMPEVDQRVVHNFALKYNLSFGVVQTMMSRGYATENEVDSFLFSSFEKDVADPAGLKDAVKAVDRIEHAIKSREKILIFGDYDVDGITSSALTMHCLSMLGADINFFLPHRVRDGYGLSTKVVERAAANGYTVIITVDNGITAFEPARRAKELGIDLIITDHHRPHHSLPDAFAVVDPHQEGCSYPFKKFAGVGVIFKVLSLLYARRGLSLPSKAYELLLLGTIADVVPLTGENRFWVRYGLANIQRYESLCLKVLKRNGNVVKTKLSSTDIGFSVTPQINALGRLEDPRQGVRFLIGSDQTDIEHVGAVLAELNKARKEIERTIFNQVQEEIKQGRINLDQENLILAASDQWPPGVIGLVASRLVSQYGRPTMLFHLTSNGMAKGSCRSIVGFNIFDALNESHTLLETFGGHSQAAGLAIKQENLGALKQAIERKISTDLTQEDLQQKVSLDAQIQLPDLTKKFIKDMEYLEPFGHENPQPVFYVRDVIQVRKPMLLKDAHVKCHIFADGVIKPIMFFNRPELFELLLQQGENSFDIAAHVHENHWEGRVNIELTGIDIALTKGTQ